MTGDRSAKKMQQAAPTNPARRSGLPRDRREAGFTLIELLVVMTLIGISAGISMTAFASYSKSAGHRGAGREVTAFLRNAQVKAVTEAITQECRFFTSRLEIHGQAGLSKTYDLDSNLQFVTSGTSHTLAHGFTHPDGTPNHTNCFFYARGSATPGVIGIRRVDTSQEYDVKLEGLTARVTYCADPTPATPCTP